MAITTRIRIFRVPLTFCVLVVTVLACRRVRAADPPLPALVETAVQSTLDGAQQKVLYWAPESASEKQTPLLVFLHSWSGDYKQDNSKWQREAVSRGWVYLHPDFRGPNQSLKACGSKFARRDILDAMKFARSEFRIDESRVYLAGTSGGGHMAMLMAGHHPDRFSAVSAWVGISDLAEWHRFHLKDGKPQRYARMIEQSLGGPPGESNERDADYRDRSPVFHLQNVGDLAVDLNAGLLDGKTGSVPIMHSLRAFNVIAKAHRSPVISEQEISQLWESKKLARPLESDRQSDPELPRAIHLRRRSRDCRITIFDGGHEGLPAPACSWLARQKRRVSFR